MKLKEMSNKQLVENFDLFLGSRSEVRGWPTAAEMKVEILRRLEEGNSAMVLAKLRRGEGVLCCLRCGKPHPQDINQVQCPSCGFDPIVDQTPCGSCGAWLLKTQDGTPALCTKCMGKEKE